MEVTWSGVDARLQGLERAIEAQSKAEIELRELLKRYALAARVEHEADAALRSFRAMGERVSNLDKGMEGLHEVHVHDGQVLCGKVDEALAQARELMAVLGKSRKRTVAAIEVVTARLDVFDDANAKSLREHEKKVGQMLHEALMGTDGVYARLTRLEGGNGAQPAGGS